TPEIGAAVTHVPGLDHHVGSELTLDTKGPGFDGAGLHIFREAVCRIGDVANTRIGWSRCRWRARGQPVPKQVPKAERERSSTCALVGRQCSAWIRVEEAGKGARAFTHKGDRETAANDRLSRISHQLVQEAFAAGVRTPGYANARRKVAVVSVEGLFALVELYVSGWTTFQHAR